MASIRSYPGQGAAVGEELVDPGGYRLVLDQRRGMLGLAPGIDDQRSLAAPVLVRRRGADARDVDGGIGTGESDPQEVVQAARGQIRIVDQHHQGEGVDDVGGGEGGAKASEVSVASASGARVGGRLHQQHAGHGQAGTRKSVGEP